MGTITENRGGDDLLRAVRAAFVSKGLTLNSWCRLNGVQHSYAHRALRGFTNGPAAMSLRARILAATQDRAA